MNVCVFTYIYIHLYSLGFLPHSCPGATLVLETLPVANDLDNTLIPCSPSSFLHTSIAQETLTKMVLTEANALVEEASKSDLEVRAVEIYLDHELGR